MNKNLKLILIGIGVYLLFTGISFGVFSQVGSFGPVASPIVEGNETISQSTFSGPRTVECPINGVLYTEEQRSIWEKRQPLLVMVENHQQSRPQSGLSKADVIYEAVAEGGITRLLAVYSCQVTEPYEGRYDLGPVRSARSYFLDWASEYGECPLYVHVGGAHCSPDPATGRCLSDPRTQALEQIRSYGWLDRNSHCDLDQFALSYQQCRREPERTGLSKATEHTMYCDSNNLWEVAKNRGFESGWINDFVPWKFKDGASENERGSVDKISFNFWSGYSAYQVDYEYDPLENVYLRYNGGEPHIDFNTGEQLSPTVVVIQFTKEIGPVDTLKHLVYETIDSGKALIFQDGEVIEGNWEKEDRQSRTIYTDQNGEEVEFTRGQIWIEILPLGNQVDYEAT